MHTILYKELIFDISKLLYSSYSVPYDFWLKEILLYLMIAKKTRIYAKILNRFCPTQDYYASLPSKNAYIRKNFE